MDNINLEAAVEGILFAAGESVAIERLCEVTSCSKPAMRQTLEKMQEKYENDKTDKKHRSIPAPLS